MINSLPGQIGHLLVIIAFIASLIATIGYGVAVFTKKDAEVKSWKLFGRYGFIVHSVAIIGVLITLYALIFRHQYEYYYAWRHSSNDLPLYYLISCFWQGQEGSFLLWMFWHVILGLILIKVNKFWEAPLMSVFAFVQTFLVSMILGVALTESFRIGSSPFILLSEHFFNDNSFDASMIPEDGVGLNALLQNYWMVIHPPTLFLGFASTLIPFSYCISGLTIGKYKEWIRPALPWTIFGGLILGLGILMGGYWAYETLSFGGYWNWDPVENAVYVPWIIMIGAIHTMIIYNKNNSGLHISVLLSVATFLLILYSTFLTRSGILGESSVHSFTDLGLSGQLLVYLLTFVGLAVVVITKSWKAIPTTKTESSIYSREFWIFIGALVFVVGGFQVLLTTSIPVFNAISENLLGIESKIAPPVDRVDHYNKIQIWFACLIALLSGIAQFFWWNKPSKKEFWDKIYLPAILSFILSAAVILLTRYFVNDTLSVGYVFLITTGIFTVICNSMILASLAKTNIKLSGGAVSHIGMGLMLIGILYSSGFSSVITQNITGDVFSDNPESSINEQGLLLDKDMTMPMATYSFTYKERLVETEKGEFINKLDVLPIYLPATKEWIALTDIYLDKKLAYKTGDTLIIDHENEFYRVEAEQEDETFTLYPRLQDNSQAGEGNKAPSPDIERYLTKDLYAYIAGKSKDDESEWSEPRTAVIRPGDSINLFGRTVILEDVHVLKGEHARATNSDSIFLAHITVLAENDTMRINPVMVFANNNVKKDHIDPKHPNMKFNFMHMIQKAGLNIQFARINGDGSYMFDYAVRKKNDWIILVAMEKPLINILWIGTLVLIVGFFMATYRRYRDFKLNRDKGTE